MQQVENDNSLATDPDVDVRSHHSSINEDAPVEPKFVPKDAITGTGKNAGGPMIMMRKATLTRDQIDTTQTAGMAADKSHNTLLECILCKNVMMDPRECNKCRKGFCKKCVNDYIDQLIQGEYAICCPSCSSTSFKLVDPHPLLSRQLSVIKARCENAEIGCTEVISYGNLEKHQAECGYANVKCSNYGCEAVML